MGDSSPAVALISGLGGGVLGAGLAAALGYWHRRGARPDLEVLARVGRVRGRLDFCKVPVFANDGRDTFILLTVRNSSPWGVARACTPEVVVLLGEEGAATRAGGYWYRRPRRPRGAEVAEDAADVGPSRVRQYACLGVTADGSLYYYDAWGTGADMRVLWRQIPLERGRDLHFVTYVDSENGRRLLGRRFTITPMAIDGTDRLVVAIKGDDTTTDFGQQTVDDYLLGCP
jgi:hypothetical protein